MFFFIFRHVLLALKFVGDKRSSLFRFSVIEEEKTFYGVDTRTSLWSISIVISLKNFKIVPKTSLVLFSIITGILKTPYELPMNFLQTSYELLMNFL